MESREGDTLMENIVFDAVHEILESSEMDQLFDDLDKQPPSLQARGVPDSKRPGFNEIESTSQFQDIKY
jgi:hypothetical protein